jgi:heme O synthase-like polyprenyltransferase
LGDTPASLSVRSRRGATTTRWASRNDDEDTGNTGPDPPAMDDVLLLLGDCTVLWLYVLYKKVSAVSAMPDFPGWLAPIDVSAQSAAAFAVECAWTLSLWVALSAFVSDAYKIDNFKTPTVKDAAVETVNAWVIWAPLQAMGAVMAMKSGLGQAASHGLLVSEVTALGVLLGWRCYAKVFSLLGPSRNADNAGRDDEEWGEFYRMFSGVAIICISCAMVEMIVYGADL